MVIVEMKKHFRDRAIEWYAAGALSTWGAYVLLYPSMFTDMEAFAGLLLLAPQHVWGFFAFTFGIVRLMALTINGFWHPTPIIRLVTAFLGVFVWFWVTVGLILTDIPSTGIVIYGWHIVADMYSAFRSAADTYEVEAQRRLRTLAEQNSIVTGEQSNVRSLHAR